MAQIQIPQKTKLNVELFAKSLERLSIFENPKMNKFLRAAQTIDVEKIIGTLDVDTIQQEMSA